MCLLSTDWQFQLTVWVLKSGLQVTIRGRKGTNHRGAESPGSPRATQLRLDDFSGGSTDTVTRPALRSNVQRRTPPGFASSAVAMPSGIVTLTDGEPSRASSIGDLKVPGMDSPITLTGGRLHNYSLWVDIPVDNALKYSRDCRLHVGYGWGRKEQMAAMAETMGALQMDAERTEKGRQIAATPGAVEEVNDGVFLVKSQSGPGAYRVSVGVGSVACNCPDFAKRNLPCKHAASVRFYLEKQTILPSGEVQSERVPVSYPQAWAAYDRAQMEEVRLFDVLLRDLVAGVPEPERDPRRAGRHPIPLADQLFCAVQKVYSQLSCRRAHSLFGFAVERGQLPKVPHYTLSSEALNRPELTPVLEELVTRSAFPLAALEGGFAPDSTGIRTTSFGAWMEDKHGDAREHIWLKAHALAGVKTHVIVRASVTGKNGGDNPEFAPLVRQAAQAGFPLKEVYADKAYSSRANYALAQEIGLDRKSVV